jgi:hypothetical protein
MAMATTTVEVCLECFTDRDSTSWIPNGSLWVELEVDQEDLEDDFDATIEWAAEQWCSINLPIGWTFSRVLMEP